MEAETRPSDSNAGLLFGVAVLSVLFFIAAVFPRDPDVDWLFGLEAWRTPGVGLFLLALIVLLVMLLVPGLAGGVISGLGRVVAFIPKVLRLPLLLAGFGAACWNLPTHLLSGDAVPVVLRTAFGDVYASNPLTSFISIGVSRALSWPAVESIRLVSCAFGLLYVASAAGIARECFPAGPARGALGLVLVCCGTSALFFGSIEVYAPLAATIGLYLYLGIRAHRVGGSMLWPALTLGVAFSLHGSAGLLLPSLGYLANGCRLWPIRFGRVLRAGLIFLIPVVLVFSALYLVTWGGDAPETTPERFGSFLGGNNQGPLLPLALTDTNVLYPYAVLDVEHLVGVVNLMLLAAPAGVLLLLLGRRPGTPNPAFRFAAVVALFLVAFPVFWNVNYTLRQDWDLFSIMGVPLALLGGLAYLSRGGGPRRAMGAALVSLYCFVPFVVSNLGDTYDRRICVIGLYGAMRRAVDEMPPELTTRLEIARRAKARYDDLIGVYDPFDAEAGAKGALNLAKSGSYSMAEKIFRRILEDEPRNARAAEGLGSVLLGRNELVEARFHLENAVRQDPWRLPARRNLARVALAEGNPAEAIHQLEIGLRRGGMHPHAGQALLELAELRSRRGEAETARVLRALAAERSVTSPED